MSRVLHLIDTSGPGGAETVFVEVASGMRAAGHTCIPLLPAEGWVADALRARGLEPLFDRSHGSFDLRYLWRLTRIIRRQRIDLVHAHLLTSNTYGSIAARLCGVPSIGTFHGVTDLGRRQRFLGLKCRLLNWAASRIVFVSSALRDEFFSRTRLRPRSVSVIHNGIDIAAYRSRRDPRIRSELGVRHGDFLVISVGNIRPAKGYEVLLRTARHVVSAGVPAQFVVVGHHKEPFISDLLKLRADLGLAESVQFVGFRPDVGPLLCSADAFLLSSHSEGFSLSTVQAMAAKLPIVATRSGGPEEILLDRVTGRMADVGDAEQLAAALIEVLQNPQIAADMAEDAAKAVARQFTLQAMLDRYSLQYLDLLSEAPRIPPAREAGELEVGVGAYDRAGAVR